MGVATFACSSSIKCPHVDLQVKSGKDLTRKQFVRVDFEGFQGAPLEYAGIMALSACIVVLETHKGR